MTKQRTLQELFFDARKVSVPVVAISTADQPATVQALVGEGKHPLVQWDAARGLTAVNEVGRKALVACGVSKDDPKFGFAEALGAAGAGLPQGGVLFVHNAHRQLASSEPMAAAANVQAVANLRDVLKKDFRMIVLLAPGFVPPPELAQDVVLLRHELPGPEALGVVVTELHAAAKLTAPEAAPLAKATDALSGLSLFAAEQQTSMSLDQHAGLDLDALWERKRVTIEQTKGLSVWRGTERLDDLRGLDSVKARLRLRLTARTPVGVVVFLDEVDKVMANVEHDTTGVRMDQLRTLLTEMENCRWQGLVALGVPGSGKSALAKAFGNEAGVPTIALDLAAMEGGIVGESETNLRQAIAVIKAVGRGNAFLIATSNNASAMRPELQRRFTKGLFFFDVLTPEQRADVWALYERKYELPTQARPPEADREGWTGAEVRNCCEEAWDTGVSLVEAAKFIVPVARSRADEIDAMRRNAHGRYLDASLPGTYSYTEKAMAVLLRSLDLSGEKVQ
jgi:hypothetical protein